MLYDVMGSHYVLQCSVYGVWYPIITEIKYGMKDLKYIIYIYICIYISIFYFSNYRIPYPYTEHCKI